MRWLDRRQLDGAITKVASLYFKDNYLMKVPQSAERITTSAL